MGRVAVKKKLTLLAALAITWGSLSACFCDPVPSFSLIVAVRDAEPDSKIVADSIVVTATDGSFTETYVMTAWDSSLIEIDIPFLEERPGLYDVLVQVPGYKPSLTKSVRVKDEGFTCRSVETVTVRVSLERLPDP